LQGVGTCHLRGFTFAITARLSGECTAENLQCSPGPGLLLYSITSTCPRGTLHLSRYLWLVTAWLSCRLLEPQEDCDFVNDRWMLVTLPTLRHHTRNTLTVELDSWLSF
jgi:hypothetical protein